MSDNSGLIVSALLQTDPILALSLDAENAYKAAIVEQGARVALYRNYERGDHRAVITTQMRKMLRLAEDNSGMVDFNGNYCGIVIDKMAGRLNVSEITTGDVNIDTDWLSPLLEGNCWDALQSTVYRGAIRDSESYIMIDPLTRAWTSEPAYDGYSGIVAVFDVDERTPMWACKIWSEADSISSETMRLVVYQPGKVSYWRGEAGGGEVKQDNRVEIESEGESIISNNARFPLAKVPLVHFVNRYENYSETGESEIRAAVPLQDIYNRTLHSMVMASEFSAFRVAWSIGMDINPDGVVPGATIGLVLRDADGNPIVEPTPDMLEFLKAVKVGQFEATDIGQYVNQLDKIVREISQVTQTPIYGITTDNGSLSGEALKQLEIGLIGKIYRFQQQNTDAIRELIRMTADVQNAFRIGDMGNAPEFEAVSVTWKSPEILDVTAQVAALTAMRTAAAGLWSDDFYRAKIGGLLGMSQSEIAQETDAVKKQSADRLRARVNSVRVPVNPDTGAVANGG